MILLTNLRTIFISYQVPGPARVSAYFAVLLATAVGLYIAGMRGKRRAAAGSTQPALESVQRL